MSNNTQESPVVRELVEMILKIEPKAIFLGSVGDTSHQLESHSYHEGYWWQNHDGGYSVHYWGDRHMRKACKKYASAFDIGFKDPDLMMKYTKAFKRWADSNRRKPKVYGIREFAGTIDGRNVFGMDTSGVRRPRNTSGQWPTSHLGHIHTSINRCMILDRRILTIARIFQDA